MNNEYLFNLLRYEVTFLLRINVSTSNNNNKYNYKWMFPLLKLVTIHRLVALFLPLEPVTKLYCLHYVVFNPASPVSHKWRVKLEWHYFNGKIKWKYLTVWIWASKF